MDSAKKIMFGIEGAKYKHLQREKLHQHDVLHLRRQLQRRAHKSLIGGRFHKDHNMRHIYGRSNIFLEQSHLPMKEIEI